MDILNHKQLCIKASSFLKGNNWKMKDINGNSYHEGRCGFVAVEHSTIGFEIPDVIGFNSMFSVMVECKMSRSDFLSDKKKIVRRNEDLGMGNFRYYYCPDGLIKPDELPDGWGLIYLRKRSHILIIESKHKKSNLKEERGFLYSVIIKQPKPPQK